MHVGAFQKADLVSVWETLCGLSWVRIAGGCWETLAQMLRSGGVGFSSHALLVQRKGREAMVAEMVRDRRNTCGYSCYHLGRSALAIRRLESELPGAGQARGGSQSLDTHQTVKWEESPTMDRWPRGGEGARGV